MSIQTDGNVIRIPIEIVPEDKEEVQQIMKGLGSVTSAATNPQGFASRYLKGMIPFIGEALIAAGFAKEVIDWAQGPGGPLDVRFRRDIPNEFYNLISLQEQQARRIGLDQVIITSFNGFHNYNGANVNNTLAQVRRQGVSPIGLETRNNVNVLDKAHGWRANT